MTQFSLTKQAATLIVFLPGRGDTLGAFTDEGFPRILREAGIEADLIEVDAHLGYYYQQTVIQRLRTDVLVPARRKGYQRIVLVGISLGGLGALLNERDNPGTVDAIVLLAPYLGDQAKLLEQIEKAGGPARWAAQRAPRAGGVEEQVWTFVGNQVSKFPPTWLLFGQGDSLAPGHRLLAGLLPSGRVRVVDGAHDWSTWRSLWRDVCFQSDLFSREKGAKMGIAPTDLTGTKP